MKKRIIILGVIAALFIFSCASYEEDSPPSRSEPVSMEPTAPPAETGAGEGAGEGAGTAAAFYDLITDPRESSPKLVPLIWQSGQWDRMLKRHLIWMEKYPNRPKARGIPFTGIDNARPETTAIAERFESLRGRVPFDPLEYIEHLDELSAVAAVCAEQVGWLEVAMDDALAVLPVGTGSLASGEPIELEMIHRPEARTREEVLGG